MVLDDIFSHSSDAVFAFNKAHQVVYRNNMFADLFHCSASGVLGRQCYDVVCGKTLDDQVFCNSECAIGASLSNGRPVPNFDLVIAPGDSDSIWVSVGSLPLSNTFTQEQEAVAVFIIRPVNEAHALNRPARNKTAKEDEAAQRLTPRECQILRLLAEGRNTEDFAEALHISYITARNHIQHIYEKLGVHSRAEAVSFAYRHHLL